MYKITLIILTLLLLMGCSKEEKRKIANGGGKERITKANFNQSGPVNTIRFNTPAGADPKISKEMGGAGFEEIAESLGYITNENYTLDGSDKAVKGGTFKMSFTEFPSTFRIIGQYANSYVNAMLRKLCYGSLLELDSKSLELRPGLATHWKIDRESNEYYFRLDPDARWSNGKPVTSEDIIETWKLYTDKEILAPYTTTSYSEFFEPEAISKYIVKVKGKEDNWMLLNRIAKDMYIFPAYHLKKIDGKSYLEKYHWKMFPGTGAYVLDDDKTIKGKKIVLRRVENYWAKDKRYNTGKFNFDQLEFEVVRDRVLEKEKFKKGDIDFYSVGRAQWWVNEFNIENPEPPFDDLTRGLVKKVKVFNYKPQGISGITFNMRKAPFDDIRMRKAVTMLWNRDQLIEKLFYNEYIPITSAYPGSIYSNEGNIEYKYNPKEANRLLDEAGWSERDLEGFRVKNKERLELDLKIVQSAERIYTPLQEDLRKAGIKLNLNIVDANSKFKSGNERRFKMHQQAWTGGIFPNPESSLHSETADPDNTTNFAGVKDERIDKLIESYNSEFNQAKRVELLKEIDAILYTLVHYAYGWYTPYGLRSVYWNKFSMPEWIIPYSGQWDDVPIVWWYDKAKDIELEKAKKDQSITLPMGETDIDYWGKMK